jgi:8-oxo-dGTP pyrophosphatase MutT (NUDIX family)
MIPAPGAGSESTKKKRRRKRPANRAPQSQDFSASSHVVAQPASNPVRKNERGPAQYTKRVDEVSAGGLVINFSGSAGLLIGRVDLKDASRERLLWSLPKGHIEVGESPEEAALREVMEETGIESKIAHSLGVIDFWFMAGGKRIHKTVHHYLFHEVGGTLAPQVTEVDEVGWFPLHEIVEKLAYPDEKKLIARNGNLFL